MVKTASEFEKFTTVLRTIEGSSSKAQSSMNWITKFAKTTPYELSQVTEAFIKLKSYGIQPTSGTLRVLGDTASAMGKPLNQAVEAMADAIVGENERLKEFGIRAAKQGDQIAYSWTDASGKAKHIIVENNSQIIESTLDAIFSSKYAGAMEDQSKTYAGMLSNMSDNWTVFKKQMMDAGAFDYIKAVIKTVGDSFSSMYSATLKNTDVFTKGLMESFKSIVVGLGKLGNAFEGIAIFAETAWNVIKAGWDVLVVSIVGGAASLIDTLNKLPGVNIDNSWSKQVSQNAANDFRKSIDDIGKVFDGIKDYEAMARAFVTDVNKQYSDMAKATTQSVKRPEVSGATEGQFKEFVSKTKKGLDDVAKKSKQTAKEMNYVFTNAFKNMEDSLVNFVKTGKLDFQSLTNSILEDMLRMQIQQSITKPLMAGFTSAGGMSGIFGSLFANAHGGAYASASLSQYSNQVIDTPTPFMFANGGVPNLGVFGEAGAEAIMPLTRIGGDLGVKSSPSNVIINIENNSGQDISAEQISELTRTNERGEQERVITFVIDGVNRNMNGVRDLLKGIR